MPVYPVNYVHSGSLLLVKSGISAASGGAWVIDWAAVDLGIDPEPKALLRAVVEADPFAARTWATTARFADAQKLATKANDGAVPVIVTAGDVSKLQDHCAQLLAPCALPDGTVAECTMAEAIDAHGSTWLGRMRQEALQRDAALYNPPDRGEA